MAAEGHTLGSRTEVEAVRITREVCRGVAREEEHPFALGAEREARAETRRGIEGRFRNHKVAVALDVCAVLDTVFLRHRRIVGEEPAAHVRFTAGGVEQLDEIDRRAGVREDFVYDNSR